MSHIVKIYFISTLQKTLSGLCVHLMLNLKWLHGCNTVPPRSYRIHNVNSGDAAACHRSIRQAMVHHHAERIAQLKRITPFDIFPDHWTLLNHFHPEKKKTKKTKQQQNISNEMSDLSRIFLGADYMFTAKQRVDYLRTQTTVCWGCAAKWMFSQYPPPQKKKNQLTCGFGRHL